MRYKQIDEKSYYFAVGNDIYYVYTGKKHLTAKPWGNGTFVMDAVFIKKKKRFLFISFWEEVYYDLSWKEFKKDAIFGIFKEKMIQYCHEHLGTIPEKQDFPKGWLEC
jgi:helix-turn-helix protein